MSIGPAEMTWVCSSSSRHRDRMTHNRPTVGVLTPHAAPGPEVELPAMSGGRVAVVVARTGSSPERSPASSPTMTPGHTSSLALMEPFDLDLVATALGDSQLVAIAHASTTSGYLLGQRKEASFVARLSERFGVPAVASCAAAAAAMRAHDIETVQLVHPPWFDDEFDELGARYFRGQGFRVMVIKAVDLDPDPARVDPQRVIEWVEQHVEDRAEAVFLAGNGFRAAEAVEELELRTGRLVVEANQALLWSIQAAARTRWHTSGYGRLLQASKPTTTNS